MDGVRARAPRNEARRSWIPALAVAPFILLCTLNSAGYRYGASDLAFYVPAALTQIDPSLFPRDAALIASQARLTTVDEVVAALVRLTGASLPVLFAALYCATLALLAAALWRIGSHFYRTSYAVLALLAAATLRHAISRTGTNTLEAYFHPRQLAFALGAVAIAGFLERRRATPIVLVIAAGLLHPTTALWFAIWLGVAAVVEDRRSRVPVAAAAVFALLAAIWLLTAGPLAGRVAIMDAEWLATLVTKDYLFPLDWPADVWLINMAYAPIILAIYRHRRVAGALIWGETGLVIGCLSLLVVFALALPFNAAHVAIVVQLQIPRVFWMLDLLATIYAVWALAEGRSGEARRAQVTAAIIIVASLARGAYVMFLKFPERPIAELFVADDDWGRAMAWARSTPGGSGWIADPMHAVRYGTSLRVAGQRDVFVESVKDTAIGMYERGVAIRTRDHLAQLADFESMTPSRARELAARHGLDYLVSEQPLEMPVAFQSGPLRVYRLR